MRSLYAAALLLTLLAVAGGGSLLSRIDRLQASQRATDARVRLVEARLELARVQALGRRDVKPPNLKLTERRVEVLRRTLSTLIAAGVHWSPDYKGMPSLEDTLWPAWPERGWDLRCEPMRVAEERP